MVASKSFRLAELRGLEHEAQLQEQCVPKHSLGTRWEDSTRENPHRVHPAGLYLAGGIYEHVDLSTMPVTPSLVVKAKPEEGDVDEDGLAIMSLINSYGTLKMRGEMIVHGVPYTLEQQHGGPTGNDIYSTYP